MKHIEVLGSCSCCCGKTEKKIKAAIERMHLEAVVVWQKDLAATAQYNIMKTPAVIIDGTIVHEGGIPSDEQIASWLAE